MYAGASGDFNLIHVDVETAHAVGLPGTIAHGMLSMGFLGQYAGELIGDQGFVQQLKVRFSGMVYPGDVLTCRGRVLAKDDQARTVRLAIAAERETREAPDSRRGHPHLHTLSCMSQGRDTEGHEILNSIR